jgi:hypothetical protein
MEEPTETKKRYSSRRHGSIKRRVEAKYSFHKRQIRRSSPHRFVRLSFASPVPPTDLEVNALLTALGDDLKRLFPEVEERS